MTANRNTGSAGFQETAPKRPTQQQKQPQPAAAAITVPAEAITELQAQFQKQCDLNAAMGKTLTDLGIWPAAS